MINMEENATEFNTLNTAKGIMVEALCGYASSGIQDVAGITDRDIVDDFHRKCAEHAVDAILSNDTHITTAARAMCIINCLTKVHAPIMTEIDRRNFEMIMADMNNREIVTKSSDSESESDVLRRVHLCINK